MNRVIPFLLILNNQGPSRAPRRLKDQNPVSETARPRRFTHFHLQNSTDPAKEAEENALTATRSARLRRLSEIDETLQSPVDDVKHFHISRRLFRVMEDWLVEPALPFPPLLPSTPSKRKRENEHDDRASPKRRAVSPPTPTEDVDTITYWTQTYLWPRECFDENGETSDLLARKKSIVASLRRKQPSDSESGAPSFITPSDQRPREEKSAPYQDPYYRSLLAKRGSFMNNYIGENEEGPTTESKQGYQSLLGTKQPIPEHSLFQDDIFEEAYEIIQDRNEAKVIQDIARLIIPSAQSLAVRGAKHLRRLIESVNEGWNNSIPLTKPRPQPDYSVGFKRSAFTQDQLQKLEPFVGEFRETSFFLGTWYMYFPFFSSEVKCGAGALDVADRQNAHSMTLAVRGVVELFRLVKRERELHREILAFSISHDQQTARIYGHYPVIIEGQETTFYRHLIRHFAFAELDGKEKWTAYQFTKNVYDIWMPAHFERLCSVIDAIPPNIHFEVSEDSELHFPSSSGLSQGLESHDLSESGATDDAGQEATPNTSVTQASQKATFKKPKKR